MQRSENYKTLIFSEMSVEDQERIMELMVNNNVEFEQSQDGNYFATIRLEYRNITPSKGHEGLASKKSVKMRCKAKLV